MLKDAQLKSLPLGWFEDKQGRIVVRLSYKNKHLIEVNY